MPCAKHCRSAQNVVANTCHGDRNISTHYSLWKPFRRGFINKNQDFKHFFNGFKTFLRLFLPVWHWRLCWLIKAVIALLIPDVLVTEACPVFRRHFQEQDWNLHSPALNSGLATWIPHCFLAPLHRTYWTLIIGYLNNFTELLRAVISFLLNLNLPVSFSLNRAIFALFFRGSELNFLTFSHDCSPYFTTSGNIFCIIREKED